MLVLFLQKQEASGEILQAMNALKEGGVTQKWGAALQEPFQRRNVFMGELKRVGVLNPQAIGIASISERPRVSQAVQCVLASHIATRLD